MTAAEGTKQKREQLYREISQISDERVRSNLTHTYYKLFMFLEEDLGVALREANKAGREAVG
jgi:hypothetical protein